jgi:hypothetical protein
MASNDHPRVIRNINGVKEVRPGRTSVCQCTTRKQPKQSACRLNPVDGLESPGYTLDIRHCLFMPAPSAAQSNIPGWTMRQHPLMVGVVVGRGAGTIDPHKTSQRSQRWRVNTAIELGAGAIRLERGPLEASEETEMLLLLMAEKAIKPVAGIRGS